MVRESIGGREVFVRGQMLVGGGYCGAGDVRIRGEEGC